MVKYRIKTTFKFSFFGNIPDPVEHGITFIILLIIKFLVEKYSNETAMREKEPSILHRLKIPRWSFERHYSSG